MAEALAAAGADIIGVSAQLEAGRQRRRDAGSTPPGATFTALTADFADRDGRAPARPATSTADSARSTSWSTTPARSRGPRPPSTPTSSGTTSSQVNLTSQFVLTREIGRAMVARGRGKIIFTASLLSFQGGINVPGYTAAKSRRRRARPRRWPTSGPPRGVNVNAIAPGYIATDNTQALQRRPGAPPVHPRADPGRPLGQARRPRRRDGVPRVRAASDYVNGVVLPVDGGWLGR